MKIHSFPPISNKNSGILILGTMPGVRSLALQQYYGHKGNSFWKIIFRLFNENHTDIYEEKVNILLNHKIALWDVLQHCEREGSADSAIKKEYSNNFTSFFNEHNQIKHVFFNGQKAKNLYFKYVDIDPTRGHHILPSTSPANTWATFEKKLMNWKIIKDVLKDE